MSKIRASVASQTSTKAPRIEDCITQYELEYSKHDQNIVMANVTKIPYTIPWPEH